MLEQEAKVQELVRQEVSVGDAAEESGLASAFQVVEPLELVVPQMWSKI